MKKKSRGNRIHIWVPDLFNVKGGIQVFSEYLLQGLQKNSTDYNYSVFIKNGPQIIQKESSLSNTNFYTSGYYPLSIRSVAFAYQIARFALWQCPSLIITTHLNFTIAAYWLKRLTGIPYWTIAHGIEAWNIQKPALKVALKAADRILCVSNYTRDRMIKEQNLDPEKVVLLPNTFDAERFQPANKPTHLLKRYSLSPQQPIILTVARLSQTEKHKGYDQVLNALPLIRKIIPTIHYILVGKGDDLPRIRQLISRLKIQNNVTLTGFIPDKELSDHYNICDVFAMPSKKEGFGIVYLEAMACGKPVLAGNQDGAVDALCQGELGVLVNPDNIEEIAQTLIEILQRTYPNSLIYQPESLRSRVIDEFGFERFQKTLARYLDWHFQIPINSPMKLL